jgi:microcystin-dependent protein
LVTLYQARFAGGSGLDGLANAPTVFPVLFSVSVAAQGGGLGHNNIPPAAIVNWMIKT